MGDPDRFEKLAVLEVGLVVEVLLRISGVEEEAQGELALLVLGVVARESPGVIAGSENDHVAFVSLVLGNALLMLHAR